MSGLKHWGIEDSRKLYNVSGWGQGYFDINGKGNMAAFPCRDRGRSIDIRELIADAARRGLNLPLLIRFSDILRDRISALRESFSESIMREGYGGNYTCVYPIKVNPQRQVVEEIVNSGGDRGMGLEAGSKPELHAVLAMLEAPGGIIICNGHKDEAYIRLALKASKLGNAIFLVVEKPSELERILAVAREERIAPNIGIRIKLVTPGSGKWEDSGGDRSKFGLTSTELLRAVERMRAEGYLGAFRLIHFHMGSQISNIRSVKEALREMGRYYVELHKLGCPLKYVDLGGGLGVDYDGSRSTDGFSINYTEQEYADEVVTTLARICDEAEVGHPELISESGRAITAHHAMLAVNVLETDASQSRADLKSEEPVNHELVVKMQECMQDLDAANYHRSWQEAQYFRDEGNQLFDLGLISLSDRAHLEAAFWQIARRTERLMRGVQPRPMELRQLQALLADKYYCNFSVFQSLPDSWAIGQEFPVMPLHRLEEQPTRQGILQDITCDSDGQIASYIGSPEIAHVLPLHPLRGDEPYYLGIFLTGAYQEILGELHNLFGDTNVVHVALNKDGSWRYEQTINGDNVGQVLSLVQYNRATLMDRIDRQVREAVKAGRLTHAEGQSLRGLYEDGLNGLPYLQDRSQRDLAREIDPSAFTG